ncbi:hypothetical protein, conserved [Trypanosoma brucei gambiense DAL972]|uniref:Serine/threonine-protein phosphatase n=1 Tax=Trypanosoma brucei gambiense (strain MHOM/CI/86/DAL972) TaxID=679716 RepID=C9ZUN2_TRYB9|nr:hypothetical protein, conserved [Trypanosoma brucei gambiense DAL972]CBH13120.1 hypothetical protein, conserved [Trypanosoma brucei gambiense DAL972]|eukprot:XP_011775397.1 hypothetical protein, conserved [Trypanosoma brucei gambiense DAL972]
MSHEFSGSGEEYLARFRFNWLMEEWTEEVARVRPTDPFSYLLGLIQAYRGGEDDFVTCKNDWCRAFVPQSQRGAHLLKCATDVQLVQCPNCRLRIKESDYRQHKQKCLLHQCVYCGERVPARLIECCPSKVRMNNEISSRARSSPNIGKGNKHASTEGAATSHHEKLWDEPPLAPFSKFSRIKLDFPERNKNPLTRLQRMWRSASIYERMLDTAFKQVWNGIEFRRVSRGPPELGGCISTRSRSHSPRQRPSSPNTAEPADYSITMEEYVDISESILSGGLVCFKIAVRILTNAIAIMSKRSAVLRVNIPDGGDAVVVGDLHGQLKDLALVLNRLCGLPSPRRYYVFNGDYVDRGSNGVGVLLHVLLLQCLFPDYVFINRGNHEDSRVNAEYGFQAEVFSKYTYWEGKQLLDLFSASYDVMAWATLVDEDVIVVHGGVPRNGATVAEIEAVGRVTKFSALEPRTDGERLVSELLWNDPVDTYLSRRIGVRHQGANWRSSVRGVGVEYLEPITENFLRLNKLKLVVRSHQMVQAGFQFVHGRSNCTVFSASNYTGVSNNRGAIAVLEKGSVQPTFHTWFLRDAETVVRDVVMSDLLEGLTDFSRGVDAEESPVGQDGNGSGDTKAMGGVSSVKDGESPSHHESPRAKTVDSSRKAGPVHSPIELVRCVDDTRERMLARVRMLDVLVGIIYSNRYALLSSFVRADSGKNGTIHKVEWCDIMRKVLNMDIPWYFLAPYLVGSSYEEGSPYIRYVTFLRRFNPCFTALFSARFQTALLRHVFRDVDMPGDLLSCITTDHFAEEQPITDDNGKFIGSGVTLSPSGLMLNLAERTGDGCRGIPNTMGGSSVLPSGGCCGGGNQRDDSWRKIRLSFNSLVSALRSISRAGGMMEDNTIFTLFQIFDKDACGHAAVGDIVDVVDSVGVEDSDESVVLDLTGSFDIDFFPQRGSDEKPAAGTTVLCDEPSGVSADAAIPMPSPVSKAGEYCDDWTPANSASSTALVSYTPAHVEMAVDSDEESSTHSSSVLWSRQSVSATMSDLDCMRVYPVLLHLHERFACDTIRSALQHFKALNNTHDGKLTFDQFAVTFNHIGRCMLDPPTRQEQQIIFCLIRDVGQHLLGSAECCSLSESLGVLSRALSRASSLRCQVALLKSVVNNIGVKNAQADYLTRDQFVTFFSTVSISHGEHSCHYDDHVAESGCKEWTTNFGESGSCNSGDTSKVGALKPCLLWCLDQCGPSEDTAAVATAVGSADVETRAERPSAVPPVQADGRGVAFARREGRRRRRLPRTMLPRCAKQERLPINCVARSPHAAPSRFNSEQQSPLLRYRSGQQSPLPRIGSEQQSPLHRRALRSCRGHLNRDRARQRTGFSSPLSSDHTSGSVREGSPSPIPPQAPYGEMVPTSESLAANATGRSTCRDNFSLSSTLLGGDGDHSG